MRAQGVGSALRGLRKAYLKVEPWAMQTMRLGDHAATDA